MAVMITSRLLLFRFNVVVFLRNGGYDGKSGNDGE